MSEKRHVDEHGYVTGYTDEKGNTYDINHQYKGHTDEKGTIYDSNYNVVGHSGDHGYIYDQNYNTVGYNGKDGVFYNQNHQRSDYMDLFEENDSSANPSTSYGSENSSTYGSENSSTSNTSNNSGYNPGYHSDLLMSTQIVSLLSLIIAGAISLFNLKFSITATFIGCSIVHLIMLLVNRITLESLIESRLEGRPKPQQLYRIWSGLCAFDFLAILGSSIYIFLYLGATSRGMETPWHPVSLFETLLIINVVFHVIAYFGFHHKINSNSVNVVTRPTVPHSSNKPNKKVSTQQLRAIQEKENDLNHRIKNITIVSIITVVYLFIFVNTLRKNHLSGMSFDGTYTIHAAYIGIVIGVVVLLINFIRFLKTLSQKKQLKRERDLL